MNTAAAYIGNACIYWSGVIIAFGMAAGLLLTLALYKPKNESTAAVWIFFPLAFVFSFVLGRMLHYYFNAESYDSFFKAMTDYSSGSFMLPGMLLGIWLAAWVTVRAGLDSSVGRLLDFASPGCCLTIAFIRLSALFNDTCRSKISVTVPIFQRLPFAVGSTDAAGNTTYRMATFFIEFLIMLPVAAAVMKMCVKNRLRPMKRPCMATGNTVRLTLVLYGAVEMIMDSTRNDSPLMHFRILSSLNKYSAFISLAQVFAAVSALAVLVYYSRMSIRGSGFSFRHVLLWVGFALSLFAIGYLGEYRGQRYGANKYLQCYSLMALGCAGMYLTVRGMYAMCVKKGGSRRAGD